MEPLRADWAGVCTAALDLIDQGRMAEATRAVEGFHRTLAATRVLDPACGTGNFLYVALARMKELEGEVIDLLHELKDERYLAELSDRTITPANFLGLEVNPRAAAIAQLVLWIGYLQWFFRVNGRSAVPDEPILKDIRSIENRDALIDWDEKLLERDEGGWPLTRWDGETMKARPVTGKLVPDEPDAVAPWPAALPEQFSAVRAVLAGAPAPLTAQDVARAFRGKRAASVRPVLDALASRALARRLKDGRYAA